jgi:midasin (ATPase involved in ribosome maturation)
VSTASRVLWNLHQYYSQLAPRIEERLSSLRKPIERELKDFVKISRWNDLNFYALKHAVDKSHRTLHKKIKQFQVRFVTRDQENARVTNRVDFTTSRVVTFSLVTFPFFFFFFYILSLVLFVLSIHISKYISTPR